MKLQSGVVGKRNK